MAENKPLPAGVELAHTGKRIVAIIIDGIILGIVAVLVSSVLGFSVSAMDATQPSVKFFIYNLVNLAISASYFGYLEGSSRQASIGKVVLGLQVVREDGSALDVKDAAKRAIILNVIFMLPNLLVPLLGGLTGILQLAALVSVVIILFNKRKQGVHDIVSKTLVTAK